VTLRRLEEVALLRLIRARDISRQDDVVFATGGVQLD
jgi:hypothetical protein